MNCILEGVRLSFFEYSYKVLYPFLEFEGLKIADERDIACMKLSAISSRGSRKDFIDIYFILKKYSLKELFGFFEEKYEGIKYNKIHLLRSLTFFKEADKEAPPLMLKETDWEKVKKEIEEKTQNFLR